MLKALELVLNIDPCRLSYIAIIASQIKVRVSSSSSDGHGIGFVQDMVTDWDSFPRCFSYPVRGWKPPESNRIRPH